MLLGVELLDRFHPNTSPWDRKVVAFAWEMVEVMMSPTVLVKVDWWTFQEWKIVVEEEASSALLGLNPDASEVWQKHQKINQEASKVLHGPT